MSIKTTHNLQNYSVGLEKIFKKFLNYFSIFTIVLGTTFGSISSANAAAVALEDGDALVLADVNEADDTLSNAADADVTLDSASGDAITFATLTSGANTTLTVEIIDGTAGDAETTDITGAVTAAAGSTLAITVTDGLLDLGASVVETGTGVATITLAAGQELNTTGADATIASSITGTATSILDVDGTATFSDTVTTGVLSIDGATTFSTTVTVAGAATIDAATTIAGDATFSSDTEPTLSDTLTFTGSTLTISGDGGFLTTDADDAKLLVDGAVAQTIAGGITPDTDDEAILENSNTAATVTFNEQIGVVGGALMKLIDTDTSTTSVFKKEVGAVLFTVDGTATLTLDSNQATNVDINSGGTLIIDDTITNGQEIFLAGTSVVDGSVAGTGNIQMPANLLDGETLVLIAETTDAADAAIVVDVEAAVLDTALRTYTVSAVAIGADDNNITITAADNSATVVASNLGTTENMGKALIQAGIAVEGDATALDAFSNALNANGFNATEDTALAKQVAPQTDMVSGSSVAAQAVTGSVQGIMSSRMASLRSGDAYFGMGVAAGGMSAQSGFIQVFGSTAEQNNTTVGSGTQYGYESDTEGLAIGFDGVTDDGMTIGVSLATANTDVDGKGTGKSTNSIDTYSASLYMDRATDVGYVEGSVTFGLNENTTSRKVNTAGLDRTYTGSYDSQSLSVNISAGAPNEVGNGYLTPFGSFTASFMDIDAYTEKSTVADDALRLKVAQDDVNSMIGTLGIKYHAEMGNGGTPMISLAINNEFGDNTIDSTNTYQGGGTAFKTSTAVEELSATLGLGYSYGSDATSIELAYEADVNDDDYLSHYGSIKVVGKF